MKIKKEINYPYDFFCFKDGVKINEETINEWIEECLNKVINDKEDSSSMASGDTEVTVEKDDENEITITVTHGRYEFTFNKKDIVK